MLTSTTRKRWSLVPLALLTMCLPVSVASADEQVDPAQAAFFESRIRPLLAANCYECHGEERQRGHLRLDALGDALAGGDHGPAIVRGDAEQSVLIEAVRYDNPDLEMPPDQKLSDRDIADLERWVNMGAPWPGSDPDVLRSSREAFTITDEDRAHWAYQPIEKPALPETLTETEHPVDAFIQATLEQNELRPNRRADRRELIRRAYFDLIGLPPEPEDVHAFVNDDSPDAFENLIDRLLARPEYGQRWARHWLDVVRFAQTNGYERDSEKRYAWRFRDYVIESFNADKPFDQFIREQLAGDELDNPTNDSIIATGFYRLGVWDDEPDDAAVAEYDYLDDIVNTTSAAFLGLTVSCARCHDHMFDPISQKDYYELLAVFSNIRKHGKSEDVNSPIFLPLGDPDQIAAYRADHAERVDRLQKQREAAESDEQKKQLDEQLRAVRSERPPFDLALAVRERGSDARETHVLIRGLPSSKGDLVQPRLLEVLGGEAIEADPPDYANSTGRRRAFADWVASEDNPLTARVIANRIWLHHFGRGIVETTTDFGNAGVEPTHPALLDWLAAEFIDNGWSAKHMHRTIMLSEAYRRSSRADRSGNIAVDPGNHLLWRQNMRRLEAEALRDTILAASGELNLEHGGRGFFLRLNGEVLAGASQPGNGWAISSDDQLRRRSIYAYVRRTTPVPIMQMFDYTSTTMPLGERPTTTVAPQALLLLNNDFMQRQARAMADRVTQEAGREPRDQIHRAYQIALNRKPSDRELAIALQYLRDQQQAYEAIADRLTFVAEVPKTLHQGYLGQLEPKHIFKAPPTWQPHRGVWGSGYSGSVSVDVPRGPFALWERGPVLADGEIHATLQPDRGLHLGGLIVRGSASNGALQGYDVSIDPSERTLTLARHDAAGTRTLAQTPLATSPGQTHALRVAFKGDRLQVWLDHSSEPIIDVIDDDPIVHGYIGARAWGATLNIDGLDVQGEPIDANLFGHDAVAHTFDNWRYFGGRWAVEPDNSHRVAPEPGAKAVWQDAEITDGEIRFDIRLHTNTGNLNLNFRVTDPQNGVNALNGYSVGIDAGGVVLGRHRHDWAQLARAPMDVQINRWYPVRITADGNRIRVYVDGADEPTIDHVDEDRPLTDGRIGIRTYNADGAVRDLVVTSGDRTWQADFAMPEPAELAEADPAVQPSEPREQALASLCLVILNLNEMVYVD